MILKLSEMLQAAKPNTKDESVKIEVGSVVKLSPNARCLGRFGRVQSYPLQVRILEVGKNGPGYKMWSHAGKKLRNGPTLLIEGVNCKGKTYVPCAAIEGSGFEG